MAERTGRIVAVDEYEAAASPRRMRGGRASLHYVDECSFMRPEPTECPKCGADLDDGECEECERSAPLDFDQCR